MSKNQPETPAECRLRLIQIRGWLKVNAHRFAPAKSVLLSAALDAATTSLHVEVFMGYAREWMLPAAEAEAQKATTDEAVRQAEADRAAWFAAREEAEEKGVPDPPYPLPETQDRAANPSARHTPKHSPAPSATARPTAKP